MVSVNISELLRKKQDEPHFCLNHDLGRGLFPNSDDISTEIPHIVASKSVGIWQVVGDQLKQQQKNVFFDQENYVVQWKFDFVLKADSDVMEDIVFFYWRGSKAASGLCPLPKDAQGKKPVVERVCQWSEPPVFFQIFVKKVIVLKGKPEDFNPNIPHLFMVRGELQSEIHLYELNCNSKSLRSRAIFFVVDPINKTICSWTGLAVSSAYQKLILGRLKLFDILKSVSEIWDNFDVGEVKEGEESTLFGTTDEDYLKIEKPMCFSPRLFYLYSLDGQLFATEVEYSLRSKDFAAPFPFLHSHLYTASQPAFFLVDNNDVVWLWKRLGDTSEDQMHQLAEALTREYTIEKERTCGLNVSVKYVKSGTEPVEFTNLFPYWED